MIVCACWLIFVKTLSFIMFKFIICHVTPSNDRTLYSHKKKPVFPIHDMYMFTEASGSPSPVITDQPGPLSRSVKLRVSRTCKICIPSQSEWLFLLHCPYPLPDFCFVISLFLLLHTYIHKFWMQKWLNFNKEILRELKFAWFCFHYFVLSFYFTDICHINFFFKMVKTD